MNLIKKIFGRKKEYKMSPRLTSINFELNCGAKAIGQIIEWSGCGDDSCEHCGPMKKQSTSITLPDKVDDIKVDMDSLNEPAKVRTLK